MFGEIKGFPEGATFETRRELFLSGVHAQIMKGIQGSAARGAESILLSGGYEDDEDFGGLILYTGEGGRDAETGRQTGHQTLVRGNLALAKSCLSQLPVRVVRGHRHRSAFAPKTGFRYGGLFRISDYFRELGRSGFYVWRFRLEKLGTAAEEFGIAASGESYDKRSAIRISRIVRESGLALTVKQMYRYSCQMCGLRLSTPAGPYAEAAHVLPLGRPHNGPDELANMLCLCPNHHVLFDYGAVGVEDDLSLIGLPGRLRVSGKHGLNEEYLRDHRHRYGL